MQLPRYVKAVATAFATGKYEGQTYGQGGGTYGDLGATMAAVFLDPEARSTVLDADPTHGQLREPLLKLYHIFRALELDLKKGIGVYLSKFNALGQQEHRQPSVFNFYLPEYSPAGPVRLHGLKAPEGMILTAPRVVGFLNGVHSLLEFGLTSCSGGFADYRGRASLASVGLIEPKDLPFRPCTTFEAAVGSSDGLLKYTPPAEAADGASVVAELDLLLTAGRLDPHTSAVIATAYNAKVAEAGGAHTVAALSHAQLLVLASAEFHSTNFAGIISTKRRVSSKAVPVSGKRPYKAIVAFFMAGGVTCSTSLCRTVRTT